MKNVVEDKLNDEVFTIIVETRSYEILNIPL